MTRNDAIEFSGTFIYVKICENRRRTCCFSLFLSFLAVLAITLTTFVMTGCGVQLGEFFSSGALSYNLKPTSGLITIDRGNRWFGRHAVDGNLLCVLVLAPTLRFQTGPSFFGGSLITSHQSYWNGDAGQVTLSYDWNRLLDTVNIEGHHFSRKKGNAFVVRRLPNRKWSVLQIASVPWDNDARAVLRHFQRSLPNEDSVAGLSIVEGPE